MCLIEGKGKFRVLCVFGGGEGGSHCTVSFFCHPNSATITGQHHIKGSCWIIYDFEFVTLLILRFSLSAAKTSSPAKASLWTQLWAASGASWVEMMHGNLHAKACAQSLSTENLSNHRNPKQWGAFLLWHRTVMKLTEIGWNLTHSKTNTHARSVFYYY